MLIVQKFHSIHEIDPEFISNIETLLQEEVPSFKNLIKAHDEAPPENVFTYFLFFGPTQNAPIGFAQLCLKSVPSEKFRSWYEKMFFWNKDHIHWKQVTWGVTDGTPGVYIFDPKFARTGKEKILELIKDYEIRDDIMAEEIYSIKGLQDVHPTLVKDTTKWSQEIYVLEPLHKAHKSYADFIQGLKPDIQLLIKENWKNLHKGKDIKLGDYQSPLETPNTIPITQERLETLSKSDVQILTFEKDLIILGCILVFKGKNGNIFFEPIPFETHEDHLINDDLYIQYSLLKFFEMPNSRKCHFIKNGSKLSFVNKQDLDFFISQGLSYKTIIREFQSKLKGLEIPL